MFFFITLQLTAVCTCRLLYKMHLNVFSIRQTTNFSHGVVNMIYIKSPEKQMYVIKYYSRYRLFKAYLIIILKIIGKINML